MASIRTYDMKVVERDQAVTYTTFGWVRSKESIPADMALKTKKPTLLMKRREEYGANPVIASNEKEYEALYKKNTKGKGAKDAFAAIFGIILAVLMIACVALAALNIFLGVNAGLEEDKKITALDETIDTIKDIEIIKTIDEKLASVKDSVVEILDGIELPEKVAPFIGFETVVGVVFLVLGVVFIIIFASICKMSKRRKARAAKMAAILETVKVEIANMKKTDITLMSKAQRKQYMWESIITNALINARAPVVEKDEDDDDDF